jgi:CpeT/CpcT family (DUF1001)
MNKFCILTILGLFFIACRPQSALPKGIYNYLEPTKTGAEIEPMDNKFEKVYYMLLGAFSNEEQANAIEEGDLSIPQQIITVPIWRERKGEYWYYSGWFVAGNTKKPLTQDIVKLVKRSRDSFEMQFFTLPDETEENLYFEEWKKPQPFAYLKPKDLVPTTDCQNYVIETSPNQFEVLSIGEPCSYELSSNRQYMHYELRLSPHVINELTVYFNAKMDTTYKNPRPDGIIFKRIDKNKAPYLNKKG